MYSIYPRGFGPELDCNYLVIFPGFTFFTSWERLREVRKYVLSNYEYFFNCRGISKRFGKKMKDY